MYFRSKPHKAIALVILFMACRKVGIAITLKKIIKMSKIRAKIVNKCLITLKKILPNDEAYNANSIVYLKSIAKSLKFTKTTAKLSYYLLKKIQSKDLLSG